MAHQEMCELTFKAKVITNLNQHVRIAGSIPELGLWNPSEALILTTNTEEYPYWSNPVPIILPKRTRFEFKLVVYEYDYLQRWENLPDGQNRKFKVRYYKSQIFCVEGDPVNRESVIEKIEDSFSSLEIANMKVKKRNQDKSGFNPFQIAASDDDSCSSSGGEFASSSFSSGSDDELALIPIKSSFYHAPAYGNKMLAQLSRQVDDGEKLRELYTQMRSQSHNRLWHTSSRYTFHDAFYDVNEEDLTIFEDKEMVYIVTFYLPVNINVSSEGSFEIVPNYVHELLGLYEYCKQYQKSNFMWIGVHKQIPPKIREEVDDLLSNEYGCHAIYLAKDMYNVFRHKCKKYLWSHLQKIDIADSFVESEDFWNTYELVSYRVAEKILALTDRGYVLINDYRFMLVPGLCTKQKPSLKFHYILNFSFPSSHSFASVPYYLQIINSMLSPAVLSFESHDDMNNFVDTVREIYGGRLLSQSGYLTLQFYGRFIILNANAHLKREYLTKEKQHKTYLNMQRQKSSNTEFEFKEVVLLSIDNISVRSGIDQKFRALEQIFTENREMRGKIKLIQVFKFIPMTNGEEQKQVLNYFQTQANEINEKFSGKGNAPIQIVLDNCENSEDVESYYSKAHIFIDTNIDKHENENLNRYVEYTKGKSLIIIHEDMYDHYADFLFTFTVNPFSVHDISAQIRNCFDTVVNLNDSVTSNVYNGKLPLSYIEEWLVKSSMAILKTNLLMRNAKIFNTYTFSQINSYEHILAACSRNFKKPNFTDIPTKYFNSLNRVFVFPLEIFFKNETLELLKLGKSFERSSMSRPTRIGVHDPIQRIAANESNVVIIITGKSKELAESVVGDIKNVHILAEDGCFYKNSSKNEWVNISNEELTFKLVVKPIMQKYQRRLENCVISEKESAIKFKIKAATHTVITQLLLSTLYKEILEALRENDKLEVCRTERSVVVRPFGINKGTVTQMLLQKTFQERGKISFLFCLGKSESDEEIFAGIFRSLKMSQEIFTEVKQIFTCAIGHRPSHANYYLNTREEVKKLLSFL